MRLGLLSTLPGHVTQAPYQSPNGLGDVSTDQQIAGVATSLATTTVGIMAALHTVILGTSLAGPVGIAVGAAIAAIGAIAEVLIKEFSGCGQTCIVASNDANKYEPYLLQNLNAYLSSPIHYHSLQQAALNNFDTIWGALATACSDPSLGAAGQRCISDRQTGACTWKASPGGWSQVNGLWAYTPAGPSGSGDSCWNWFVGYRDPIANDPSVVPDPTPGGSNNVLSPTNSPTTAGTVVGSSGLSLPLILGAAAVAFLLTEAA